MTNYTIKNISDAIHVVNDKGEHFGGPYKNEESAKRRIRDLKRREAEALKADGDTGTKCITAEVANDVARDRNERDQREAEAEINSDMIDDGSYTGDERLSVHMPDAMKLAASSAYGKSIARGVYPAIGKREYRKRWNYA